MAEEDLPSIAPLDHTAYMQLAILLAEKAIPKSTNFRVGALLVDEATNQILSTGYTLELPGNTHAEQCCLDKYGQLMEVSDAEIGNVLPERAVLYTTMEPCDRRASGNVPCTDRILKTRTGTAAGIQTVYLGVTEPKHFMEDNTGRTKLEANGVKCVHVSGLEEEILKVATAGHKRDPY
jgi:pyrimidine deaminase RibD-like protein